MVVCPACASENPEGVRFCGSCGGALAVACPSCGAENPPGFRFCGSCGASLGVAEEAIGAPAAGERRRVTVLFADLVGFSTLAEHLDPEELRTLMTETFAELTEEVERREGWVEKFIGDAVVAVFGASVAHEDDPDRAVEAALAMHDVLRRRSEGAPGALELRAGINTGLVVVGTVGDGTQTGVMGDAVNVAARLQQVAEPGTLVVSASTWRRVRDRYAGEAVGSLDVKGREQPVEAYRVLGRRERDARRRAPFVGRQDERALLELLWSSVRKGNTHVVSVVGEPGVGKSRLLSELHLEGNALDVRLSCGDERAYGPFLDLIGTVLQGLPASIEELERKAASIGLVEEEVRLLGAFLGLGEAPPAVRMADEQRKRQVFAGIWQFLLRALGDGPALIALDDVHWADESSRDLLGFLLERLGGVPLMLVLCYRPGFDQLDRSEFRASHTVVRLEPLSPDESVELARGFLGVDALPADLERLVATRAEGNPFFIEEVLQALLELGSLAVVDGRAVLAKVDVEVPDTVQGTVLARVDRLDPTVRSVLQHAAVLGRAGSVEVLEEVFGEGDLSAQLDVLGRSQLFVASAPGEWAFKHALIQEVTYDTLLLRHRRELHEKVAAALERRVGDDPELLEALADHYARADVSEKARAYAVAAGDLARERLGFAEAIARYEAALRLWGEGDVRGRLELLFKLGETAAYDNSAAARNALIEAEQGWLELGEPERAGEVLARLGRVYWQLGEGKQSMETLERAIALLGDQPSAALVQAYVWASATHMLSGRIAEGSQLAERGLGLAEALELDGARSHLLNTLGSCQVFTGDVAGVERIRKALDLAIAVGELEAIQRAYINLTDTLIKIGRLQEAVEVAEEGRAAARRSGAPAFLWFLSANEAEALIELGRLAEAEALTNEILAQPGAAPLRQNAGSKRAMLLLRRGDYDAARAEIDVVLPIARGLGGAEFFAPVLALEAELEQARGNLGAARRAIREALDVAETAPYHMLALLPNAVRLLPVDEASALLTRVRELPSFGRADAVRVEAEGVLRGDAEGLREAADLYASLEMPYDEARCRIEAGDLGRARDLAERFGFGGMIERLAQEPRPIHSSPPS